MLPFSALTSSATRCVTPLSASSPLMSSASYWLIPLPIPVALIFTNVVATSTHSLVLVVHCRKTSLSPLWSIHSLPLSGSAGAVAETVICVMS